MEQERAATTSSENLDESRVKRVKKTSESSEVKNEALKETRNEIPNDGIVAIENEPPTTIVPVQKEEQNICPSITEHEFVGRRPSNEVSESFVIL